MIHLRRRFVYEKPILRQKTAAFLHYENVDEFILEAIKTLLMARKDLRVEIACRMFQKREISLGKAMEIFGLNIVKIKKSLKERGIERVSDESLEEIKSAAEELLKRTGGAPS